MDWPESCLAVIPCLNEEKAIGNVVQAVRRYLPTVLVVDDGSSDNTAKNVLDAGAVLLQHERNLGKGAAIRGGLNWAQQKGFRWALMMDGDGQHSSDDIPAFFSAALESSAVLIVGNRMHQSQNMPVLRRWVNRWMSQRLSKAAKQDLPDSQCGFRLMNLDAWKKISVSTSRFEIESEILLQFVRAGLPIRFVPIRVIYKDEKSKIHPLQDTLRWFRWWRRVKHGK
jgi:glycosyltransferase involved in cell wall biosynthesis